jgi:hypothetical protein
MIDEFSSSELGEIAVRDAVAVIGVSDAGLAKGITDAIGISGGSA